MKLSRAARNDLISEAFRFNREVDGADTVEVSDHVFGYLMEREEEHNLMGFPATEISDYAYGVALFVTKGRDI